MMEILFVTFTFLSLVSIIGYGSLFKFLFLKNSNKLNIGLLGFLGLFLISFISYLTHLFYPHNHIHNLILLISGFIFFIYFLRKKEIVIKKQYYLILAFLFVGIIIGKSHDDFPYYHLPNALEFVENKLEFGLGNLNHGFKHHSSIFYLYSVFYFPIIKFYIFNVLNFFFLLFAVFFLFDSVNNDLKKFNFNNKSFLKVLFLILFISIFNRIGEYGTDITGQLLAGVMICLILDTVSKKKIIFYDLIIIFSFLAYLITIKTYFIIYIILPIVLFIFIENKYSVFKKFIFSKLFVYLFFVGLLFVILNISATGCIIYPISKLCFPNYFYWGLKLETINYLSNWYEIWAKAGAGPDFREQDPLKYIEGLNWLNNWIDRYFFNKVSDFLLSIFLGFVIVFSFFRKNFKINNKIEKRQKYILFTIVFLFLIWFFKFPSLRYGGHILILSILIITFSSFFRFDKVNYYKLNQKFILILSISIFIFFSKNLIRIKKEFNYSAVENFKSFPLFYVKKVNYDEIFIDNEKVFKVEGMCWATPSPCLRNINKRIERKYNYRIYFIK